LSARFNFFASGEEKIFFKKKTAAKFSADEIQ